MRANFFSRPEPVSNWLPDLQSSKARLPRRLVSEHPWLLAKRVGRDLEPVVRQLEEAGCSGANLRLLLWEYPVRKLVLTVARFKGMG